MLTSVLCAAHCLIHPSALSSVSSLLFFLASFVPTPSLAHHNFFTIHIFQHQTIVQFPWCDAWCQFHCCCFHLASTMRKSSFPHFFAWVPAIAGSRALYHLSPAAIAARTKHACAIKPTVIESFPKVFSTLVTIWCNATLSG